MEPRRSGKGALSKLSQVNFSLVGLVIASLFLCRLIYTNLQTPVAQGLANVPTRHADGQVHIHDMNVLTTSTTPLENKERVLILTPLARFYPDWWNNLVSLNYPHDLVDVGIIVPDNKQGDEVLVKLNAAVDKFQRTTQKFRRITILRQDTPSLSSQSEKDRHALNVQTERRRDMSLARNSLLFTTIQSDTSWVLWLDGDITETPASLVQDMASHNLDVLVANCWQKYTENGEKKERAYDFNSWQDSDIAQEMASKMGPDEILLEGYSEMATYRTLMAHLRDVQGDPKEVIPLDGVGGTALMVRADVHRDGAMFPPFSFYHLIETEGFAKMCQRLGYQVFGLPNYIVYHYNE